MDDGQNTLIQDKSASPGHQFDFLIGRASHTWLLFPPSVWSWKAHWSGPLAICVVVEPAALQS